MKAIKSLSAMVVLSCMLLVSLPSSGTEPGGGGDGGPTNPGGMGCYNPVEVSCIVFGYQAVWCNFTGTYGAPYQCTEWTCFANSTLRRCVPKQE